MHRTLQRQLRRTIGVTEDQELVTLLAAARALARGEEVSPALAALLSGLEDLLGRVDSAYEQFDRDLALRTRSLELSSQELGEANDRLRQELDSRNRALLSLQETAASMISTTVDHDQLARNDLESISRLMARLVDEREAERRELDNQKFALDQHAIVSITDTDGVIIYANQRFCDISGYTAEELIGQTHRIVNSGVNPPALFADLWQTITAGRVWHGEICNRSKSGRTHWVAATVVPFLDAAGQPTRYIAIRTDISERKAMETRLQEQLRLVEEVIEGIPLPLYFKDTSGRYLRLNRAFELFFAVRREDLLGRDLHSLLRPEEARIHTIRDAELLACGGTQVYEASVHAQDGRAYETIYRKAALTRPDGSISGLLGTIIDITDRKQAEQSMRQATAAAEAANRAKSDFLANMSHEIRTPMNGVIGMTDLALSIDLPEEAHDYLLIVKSSAESLLTVINDILDFSKIEAGKMLIEHISFNLPRLIADTVKTLAMRAHEKNLELVVDIAPGLPQFVRGDPGRLRQILLNLVGNAIKFTEQGEIVIRLTRSDSSARLCIEVIDTGIGIAHDKLEHIFEAFTQEDTSTTRRFGGTGLGLTISHRLVTMMGGQLSVRSKLGSGSTFRVDLPLPADSGRQDDELPPASLSGMPVALVDNNETNRLVLSRMLANWGMQVAVFASAAELLAHYDTAPPPRLFLLDAHMPGMDGFALAASLRDDPRFTAAPRIMLSSGAMPGDAERCREYGIAAYFSKPLGQEDLLAGLYDVLGQHHPMRRKTELVTRHSLRDSRQELAVLLVEDHPFNRKLAISLLEKWGHRVSVANNGQEAIAQAAAAHFDVILMDVQMPVMGGLEATVQLRRNGCTARIIAMTANAMEGDRDICLQAGMDDYIAKPIKADDLYLLLQQSAAGSPAAEDFDYLAALHTADPEAVEIVAPLFNEGIADEIHRLRQALEIGDHAHASRQIHTLRGLVGNFNATPVIDCTRRMEEALKAGRPDDAKACLPALEAAIKALVAALHDR